MPYHPLPKGINKLMHIHNIKVKLLGIPQIRIAHAKYGSNIEIRFNDSAKKNVEQHIMIATCLFKWCRSEALKQIALFRCWHLAKYDGVNTPPFVKLV